jgi:hypothetical protein
MLALLAPPVAAAAEVRGVADEPCPPGAIGWSPVPRFRPRSTAPFATMSSGTMVSVTESGSGVPRYLLLHRRMWRCTAIR